MKSDLVAIRRHGAAVVVPVGVAGLLVLLMGAIHLFEPWLEATLTAVNRHPGGKKGRAAVRKDECCR